MLLSPDALSVNTWSFSTRLKFFVQFFLHEINCSYSSFIMDSPDNILYNILI